MPRILLINYVNFTLYIIPRDDTTPDKNKHQVISERKYKLIITNQMIALFDKYLKTFPFFC